MAIAIREARPGDEMAVAEVHVRSWQEAYRELMPAEFLAGLDPRDRAGRYTFGAAEPTTLIAAEDGADAVLGFATFGASRDEDVAGLGEVYALYVDPVRYERGVGRTLMAAARERLCEAGFAEAVLWVLRGNERAERFYEREGWEPDGTTRIEEPYGIVSSVRRFRRAL
jgi:GNAT superfamily N-acetyltransferase